MEITNKSPLRYPGGKTRASKKLEKIIQDHFPNENFDTIVSPFFGGGSFEFHFQNNHQLDIIANDIFKPLYTFWKTCKSNSEELCDGLEEQKQAGIHKEEFANMRKMIMNETDDLKQSIMYFIINRCSFSGATLSGGFSSQASQDRFTPSSIQRIKSLDLSKFEIYNMDFEEFISEKRIATEKSILFLDPPYYLEGKSRLYGNNGDLHEHFPHERLHECLLHQSKWLMTYNDCEYIRDLYKEDKFTIISESWSYGMNKSKASSEIIIIAMY
jgi:DNA adenine methylase